MKNICHKYLKIGDKVTVRMPSGVIVPNGALVWLNFDAQECRVYWEETETFFTVDIKDLLPPF
jgi:hypothetical protein